MVIKCATLMRQHLEHGILGAEWIMHAIPAIGVVPPLAIDKEPIVIGARIEQRRGLPGAVPLPLKRDGMLLPLSKVTDQ
jgi:hypothetical protein